MAGIVKLKRLAIDYASYLENESTCFQTSPKYTTTSFGAFGYVPGKKRTLCGQCERKARETLDVQPTSKKRLSDGEHRVQRGWMREKA